ncbi:hypothetical protein ACWKT3_24900 [Streptomyces violaceus]
MTVFVVLVRGVAGVFVAFGVLDVRPGLVEPVEEGAAGCGVA